MDSPRAKHHGHGGEVATGEAQEGATGPVGPVPMHQHRPQPLDARGPVVAEGEEGDEQGTEEDGHKQPAGPRLERR